MIRSLRVIAAVVLLITSIGTFVQPEIVENVLINTQVSHQHEDSDELLGIQENERWLVIIIEFDGLPVSVGKDATHAQNMLMGVDGADDYIDELTASNSILDIVISESIYSAPSPPSAWGTDHNGNRDVASDGSRPSDLASSVIRAIPDDIDLNQFDLDNDGTLDRLLMLHTGRPQETSGKSSDIWSHFQHLSDPIEKGNTSISHYTMASFQSGLGTIIHEMIHQMGGLDLYDVHDDYNSDEWNGVGDFDIMSSGNWNGNGRTPSLPMSVTMELIGLDRSVDATSFPSSHINLTPMSAGGNSLLLHISPTETVYFEYRGDIGFDRELPGHGLLVSIKDEYQKDITGNEVNIDPSSPFLRILEADSNSDLVTGSDSGSQSDLFVQGDIIGSDGYLIYDAHGRIVDWNVTVIEMNSNSIEISIQFISNRTNDVLPERSTIELLPDDSIELLFDIETSCIPWISLISTDNRNPRINITSQISGQNISISLDWVQQSIIGSSGTLSGTIGCGADIYRSVIIKWAIVPHKMVNSFYETTISYDDSTQLYIPVELVGEGDRIYSVSIEGALDRIADIDSTMIISESNLINVTINPNGLLTPNMFAEGTIVLYTEEGTRSDIDITLYTENIRSGPFGDYIEPATLVSILILLLSITVLPSFTFSKNSNNKQIDTVESFSVESNLSIVDTMEVDEIQDTEYYQNDYFHQ